MENQVITINKNNLLKILKSYYSKENAEVTILTAKEPAGLYKTETCVTKISVKRKINISGVENILVKTLDENDLKNVLSEVLADSEIEVQDLDLLNNLESRTTGYGMAEHTELYPEFRGVNLIVKHNPVKKLVRD